MKRFILEIVGGPRSRYWECGGMTPTVRSSSFIKHVLQEHFDTEDNMDTTRIQ